MCSVSPTCCKSIHPTIWDNEIFIKSSEDIYGSLQKVSPFIWSCHKQIIHLASEVFDVVVQFSRPDKTVRLCVERNEYKLDIVELSHFVFVLKIKNQTNFILCKCIDGCQNSDDPRNCGIRTYWELFVKHCGCIEACGNDEKLGVLFYLVVSVCRPYWIVSNWQTFFYFY